jgi:hypothetical protein
MPLDRSEFAQILQRAVAGALGDFRQQVPDQSVYAIAVILGQCGNYLGYAIATDERLRRAATRYAEKGYRYQGWEWEEFDNLERLSTWLRWANPDDGWQYGDFHDRFGVARSLASLVESGAFGEDAEELEEFCTEALATSQSDPDWLAQVAADRVIVGVTSGSDPRVFLRTATRANRYGVVRQLWAEYWCGEELSNRILAPG